MSLAPIGASYRVARIAGGFVLNNPMWCSYFWLMVLLFWVQQKLNDCKCVSSIKKINKFILISKIRLPKEGIEELKI